MTLREDALYASYRRLERPLYNVLFRQLWQAEDCQDVIHDAYVRMWERRGKVEESHAGRAGLDDRAEPCQEPAALASAVASGIVGRGRRCALDGG